MVDKETSFAGTERAAEPEPIDYLGFIIDGAFVVGYGIDLDGRYHNLPGIATLAGPAQLRPFEEDGREGVH